MVSKDARLYCISNLNPFVDNILWDVLSNTTKSHFPNLTIWTILYTILKHFVGIYVSGIWQWKKTSIWLLQFQN